MLWAPGLPRSCEIWCEDNTEGEPAKRDPSSSEPLFTGTLWDPRLTLPTLLPLLGSGLCHSLGRRREGQPGLSSTSWAPGGHWGQQHLHLGSREGALSAQGLTVQWGRPSSTVHWPAAWSWVPWHPAPPSPTPAWCLGSPSLAGTQQVKAACPARRRRSWWGRGPACSVQGPSAPPGTPSPAFPGLSPLYCLCGWCCQRPSSGRRGSMTMEGVEVRKCCSPKPRELQN